MTAPAVQRTRTTLSAEDERRFQEWYSRWAQRADLDPNPDSPLHKYDYRGAFRAGIEPEVAPEDGLYHWPSEYKDDDHPNRFVAGIGDTKHLSRSSGVTGPAALPVPYSQASVDHGWDGSVFRAQLAAYDQLKASRLQERLTQAGVINPHAPQVQYLAEPPEELFDAPDSKLVDRAMFWGATREQAESTPRQQLIEWIMFNNQAARPSDEAASDLLRGAGMAAMYGVGVLQGLNRGLKALPLVGEAYEHFLGGKYATSYLNQLEEGVRASTPQDVQSIYTVGKVGMGIVAMIPAGNAAWQAVGRYGVALPRLWGWRGATALSRSALARGFVQGVGSTVLLEGGSEEAKAHPFLVYGLGAGLGVAGEAAVQFFSYGRAVTRAGAERAAVQMTPPRVTGRGLNTSPQSQVVEPSVARQTADTPLGVMHSPFRNPVDDVRSAEFNASQMVPEGLETTQVVPETAGLPDLPVGFETMPEPTAAALRNLDDAASARPLVGVAFKNQRTGQVVSAPGFEDGHEGLAIATARGDASMIEAMIGESSSGGEWVSGFVTPTGEFLDRAGAAAALRAYHGTARTTDIFPAVDDFGALASEDVREARGYFSTHSRNARVAEDIRHSIELDDAIAQAEATNKVDAVVNTPIAPEVLNATEIDDAAVVAAQTASNPGGVNITPAVVAPEKVVRKIAHLQGTNTVFAKHNNKLYAITSDEFSNPNLVREFEQFGMFGGQTAIDARTGVQIRIVRPRPDGQAVVRMESGTRRFLMPMDDLAPNMKSHEVREVPEMWDAFLEYANTRAIATAEEVAHGVRSDTVVKHVLEQNITHYMDDFFDIIGMSSVGSKARISAYFNNRYIEDFGLLVPAERIRTHNLVDEAVAGSYMSERGPTGQLDELAARQGFDVNYAPDGRVVLSDVVGPQTGEAVERSGHQVFDTPAGANEYLRHLDRELPDLSIPSPVPGEVAAMHIKHTPGINNVNSQTAPKLADALGQQASDAVRAGEAPDSQLAFLADRLRSSNDPQDIADAVNTLQRGTLMFSDVRRSGAAIDDVLNQLGLGELRFYGKQQDLLAVEDARSNMFAELSRDYVPVTRMIRRMNKSNGEWTRIYEIQDDAARLAAAKAAGFNAKEIAAFKEAEKVFHKWFGQTGIQAERELRHYIPHLQKAQRSGDWSPISAMRQSRGPVHPLTDAFFEQVRQGKINVREMDPDHLFLAYASSLANEASGYNAALKAFQTEMSAIRKELPELGPLHDFVDGWLHALQYGHSSGPDHALDAAHVFLQKLIGPSVTRQQTRQLVNAGLNLNYSSLMGFRVDYMARDIMQLGLAMPRLGTDLAKSVLHWMRGGAKARQAMWQRGIDIGVVSLRPQRSVNPSAVHELQEFAATGQGGASAAGVATPRERAILGALGKIEDMVPDFMLHQKLHPTHWYGMQGETMRAIVGDAAERRTRDALVAYSKSGNTSEALGTLLEDIGATSMRPAVRREAEQLAKSGQFDALSRFMAREHVGASQFYYGAGRSPLTSTTLTGKLFMQLGTYPLYYLQYLEELMLSGAHGATKAKALLGIGATSAALKIAADQSGWDLTRMNPFTPAIGWGGPSLTTALETVDNVGRVGAMAGQGDFSGVAGALGGAALTGAQMLNPVRGISRTVEGIVGTDQMPGPDFLYGRRVGGSLNSPLPAEATARLLLTGERSNRPDMARFNPFYIPLSRSRPVQPQDLQPMMNPVRAMSLGTVQIPQQAITQVSPLAPVDTMPAREPYDDADERALWEDTEGLDDDVRQQIMASFRASRRPPAGGGAMQ